MGFSERRAGSARKVVPLMVIVLGFWAWRGSVARRRKSRHWIKGTAGLGRCLGLIGWGETPRLLEWRRLEFMGWSGFGAGF